MARVEASHFAVRPKEPVLLCTGYEDEAAGTWTWLLFFIQCPKSRKCETLSHLSFTPELIHMVLRQRLAFLCVSDIAHVLRNTEFGLCSFATKLLVTQKLLRDILKICRIWGSHTACYEEYYLLGCSPSACHLISLWFLTWLRLRPWRWRRYVHPKRRLNFNWLHGVISQKIVLFII
jgi:hypothetical protein